MFIRAYCLQQKQVLLYLPLLSFYAVLSYGVLFFTNYRWFCFVSLLFLTYRLWRCHKQKLYIGLLFFILLFVWTWLPCYRYLQLPDQDQVIQTQVKIYVDTREETKYTQTYEACYQKRKLKLYFPKQKAPNLKEDVLCQIKGKWNPGRKASFAYGYNERAFLASQACYGKIKVTSFRVLKKIRPIFWRRWRYQLQQYFQSFPPRTACYLQQLLLGKNELKGSIHQAYQKMGIIHVFSLSGLQLLFFLYVFRQSLIGLRCPKCLLLLSEASFLMLLTCLGGGGPAVIRASLQYLLFRLGSYWHQPLSLYETWSGALLLHLLLRPALFLSAGGILTYFLSFIAYLTYVERMKYRFLSFFFLSAPILSRLFFHIYYTSPLWNFLLLPFFSFFFVPFLCLYALLMKLFYMPRLQVIVESLLVQIEQLLLYGQNFSVTKSLPPFSQISLIFLCFMVLWYWQTKRKEKPYLFLGACALLCSIQLFPWQGQVTALDVGQGDALFCQAPRRWQENYLIDCGGALRANLKDQQHAERYVFPYLSAAGVRSIQAVFLTHLDADHMGNLLVLAKNYPIKTLYYPAGCEQVQKFCHLKAHLQNIAPNLHYRPLLAGQSGKNAAFTWEVLWPLKKGQGKNEDSLVLKIKAGKKTFLLMGDAPKEVEANLTLSKVDILKVGHHGSRHSTSPTFLKKVQAQEAWISCGKDNRFGHPHAEVLSALQKQACLVLRTDQEGCLSYRYW